MTFQRLANAQLVIRPFEAGVSVRRRSPCSVTLVFSSWDYFGWRS